MTAPSIACCENAGHCGCCAGIEAVTPVEVFNRPGLSAVAYRVGTHRRFKRSMLARLSMKEHAVLRGLSTRDDDDFSIALLDGWATIADVLSFHQERYVNECWLRTARERYSVLQLARLIGYELNPGVAAATHLALTLEDAPGSPASLAIEPGLKVQSVPGPDEKPQTFETDEPFEARVEWNAIKARTTKLPSLPAGRTFMYLKGAALNLSPGDGMAIVGGGRQGSTSGNDWAFRTIASVSPDTRKNVTRIDWVGGLSGNAVFPAPSSNNPSVLVFRQRAALFGHNSLELGMLPKDVQDMFKVTEQPPLDLEIFLAASFTSIWQIVKPEWANFVIPGDYFDLDAAYPKIVANGWIALVNTAGAAKLCRVEQVKTISRADYGLSGKVTRITPDIEIDAGTFGLRTTTVFAQSEPMEPADEPISTFVDGASIELQSPMSGLAVGRPIVISEVSEDNETQTRFSELRTLAAIQLNDGVMTLVVDAPLSQPYQRHTMRINANVVHATHGESVREVLGGGDASAAHQRFILRQPPLTHVSAATPNGSKSTLEIRVNDQCWNEVSTLFGRSARERVYAVRTEDDGSTIVQFGDGRAGSRLPTGQNNVRALYRKGIGLAGRVRAGQLSQLMSRPLGLKGAVNPEPATGGQDPEPIGEARTNAPLRVLTLDRAVSLQDYEDFARTFAGIAKALATWTWKGSARRVFLTVAGQDGEEIQDDSDTLKNMMHALRAFGDPYVNISAKSYESIRFKLSAKVWRQPEYELEPVQNEVHRALSAEFSFDSRSFGQPVALSEVIAVIHRVPGVLAVDVDKLHREDRATGLRPHLIAAKPVSGDTGEVAPAELLTIHPETLSQVKVMP